MTTNILGCETEAAFIRELTDAREEVARMEAQGIRETARLTDTRKKVAFLETFVEPVPDAANDTIQMKAEFVAVAGQLVCDAAGLFPWAVAPITGFVGTSARPEERDQYA